MKEKPLEDHEAGGELNYVKTTYFSVQDKVIPYAWKLQSPSNGSL